MLNKFREIDLQMNIKKCEFDVEIIVFLNVIISESDLRMNSKKIKIIVNWIISINLKEMQGFVKFANFYRQFIKNFLKVIRSLMKLTKKDQSFVWDEACSKVFQEFKNQIVFVFIFRHFDSKKQTMLKINLFNWMIDEVLSQHDDDEILYSMTFYNKSFNLVEINYHIYNKKLLIIIRCFEHWHFKLAHTKFFIQIFINYQILKIFIKNKQLIRRQAKYLNILFNFNFKIIFRINKTNIKTDALICMFDFHFKDDDERIRQQHQIILISNKMQILINLMNKNDFTFDRID